MPLDQLSEILVPIDYSPPTDAALNAAFALAQRFGSRVRLLHVYLLPGFNFRGAAWMLGPEEIEDVGTKAKEALQAKALALRAVHPSITVETMLVQGRPVDAILQAIDETAALVVMGTHGHGFWSRAMLGSVTREVVRRATRPVLTVHAAGTEEVRGFSLGTSTILVPVEFNETSLRALDFAIDLAKKLSWSIRALHTFQTPDGHGQAHDRQVGLWREAAERTLERLLQERRALGVPIEGRVYGGAPVKGILEQAKDPAIGMIAMATHDRTALAEALLGEVAQEIVRLAPCPVMTCAGGAATQG